MITDCGSFEIVSKCPSARPGQLVGCMVLSLYRASQIESPLPPCLARRPTSGACILSSSRMFQGFGGVMRHKVSRDTDTPDST